MITVVNKRATSKGEYIGRPSPLGNPFKIKSAGGPYERGETIPLYERWLRDKIAAKDPAVCAEMNRLYKLAKRGDLQLVCWCAPLACHGDVVKKILDEQL